MRYKAHWTNEYVLFKIECFIYDMCSLHIVKMAWRITKIFEKLEKTFALGMKWDERYVIRVWIIWAKWIS